MQVVVLLLLVAALALLVLGLMTGSTPLVVASIAASLLAAYVIVRVRRQRGSVVGATAASGASRGAEASGVASGVASGAASNKASVTGAAKARVAGAAVPAQAPASAPGKSAHAPPQTASATIGAGAAPADSVPAPHGAAPAEDVDLAGLADLPTDEPAVADSYPPLRSHGDEPVWVIDGRPRYHLPHCGFLLARRPEPEPVPLRQAVEDGFSPCALCDPDTGLTAAR
ncbi:MAG: hypothetical protein ABIQ09_02395 [Jatrophihabitantaceae bacterium]